MLVREMEEIMTDRIELNDQDVENIAGGAFYFNSYTNEDGTEYMTCRVDDVGTFYCSESAKRKIALYVINNRGASVESVIDYAVTNGYFW